MRKLIFAINISLDGCCDHTKMTPTEDIHDYFTQLIRDAGLLVYGRKTYELMVPFWPDMAKKQSAPTKALNDFALAFDATPKVVFSKTLDNVEDKNTTVIRTGLTEEILRLKQVEGKDILLGGVTLSSQLIELGLVDEYYFVVQPIIAGEGARLLKGVNPPGRLQLKLTASKVLASGCVALHYAKE